MLRLTGGALRGTCLRLPPGSATRPTSSRARAALFDLLAHGPCARPLSETRFVDLFAGTGAVGLEALSRGASSALFVEHAPTALAALRANIRACRMTERATVAAQAAPGPAGPHRYGIVFLDPPYGQRLADAATAALTCGDWLAADAVVIVQIDPRETFTAPESLTLRDDRRYGGARLLFLEHR